MMVNRNILVTGGLGYIGSNVVACLLSGGYSVIIVDNLVTGKKCRLDFLKINGGDFVKFEKCDVRDEANLVEIILKYKIDAVIHLAGLKSVDESFEMATEYFSVNVGGAISLMSAMNQANVFKLIFSSSASIYGTPQSIPIDESHPINPESPYAVSKAVAEELMRKSAGADKRWSILALRYFNPIGAGFGGKLADEPSGEPPNLMPYLFRVAVGEYSKVKIFGDDYDTPDGTAIRDYIGVEDLARGHLAGLEFLENEKPEFWAINLGTGSGTSVLELLTALEKVSGKEIPYVCVPRRKGDVSVSVASPTLAGKLLFWKAELGLEQMCQSVWRQTN